MTSNNGVPKWQQEAMNKIIQHVPNIFTCVKCESKEFQISHSPIFLAQVSDKPQTGILGFTISCRQCGHTDLYSLTALGIRVE